MPIDAARAKSLFLAAADLTDPAARAAYLERECCGDDGLRARVEALLRANDAAPLSSGTAAEGPGARDPQRLPATEMFVDSSERLGTVIAGKYRLVEVIGKGGMGCVYLAKQTEPVQRMVAVKLIRPRVCGHQHGRNSAEEDLPGRGLGQVIRSRTLTEPEASATVWLAGECVVPRPTGRAMNGYFPSLGE